MRTLPLLLALVLGLAACGQEEALTPAMSAALACEEVADLLERPALRTADVARLARAREAADAAADGDPRWRERARAVRALDDAAADVVESAERDVSNAEQRVVNDAYRAAVARAGAAC